MADFKDPLAMGRLTVSISDALLRTIFDIIVSAWPQVTASGIVSSASKEDQITDKLYDEMYAEKYRRELDNIDFEREPQSNLAHEPLPLGYIDVKVSYNNWRKSDYFAIECKKVSATRETPAKAYVDDGVLRFVSEKYSSGHPWGGMLGYVIDGDAARCADLLQKTLATHNTSATNVRLAWHREMRFSDYPHCYRSDHEQQQCKRTIALLHVLLAFPTAQTPPAHE